MAETEKESSTNRPEMDQISDDGQEFRIIRPGALEAIERAEIDVAISTAKKYPRDIADSIKMCKELALRNPAIAKTCNYAVPRGGKMLVGPSVHFARIVAYAWGNQTALARVIGCDHNDAHLQGVFHDLQTNSRIGIEMDWPVQAPKAPNDTPQRWKDQMALAKRAGAAVALRTAIFNCIPMALFMDIAETAKLLAVGQGRSFLESRDEAVKQLKALGITQDQLYRYLSIGGLESITTDNLIHLHALLQAISDGTLSVIDVFGTKEDQFEKAKTPPSKAAQKTEQKAEKPVPPPPAPKKEEKGEPDDEFFSPADVSDTKKKKAAPKPEKIEKEEKPTKEQPKIEPKEPKGEKSLVEQVRERLSASKIDESQVVAWLIAVQCMSPGQDSLEQCKPNYLEALLGQWDQSIELINKFFAEEGADV